MGETVFKNVAEALSQFELDKMLTEPLDQDQSV